ncbi:MAG: cytochrome c1 [Pseudomonadota bacterium]
MNKLLAKIIAALVAVSFVAAPALAAGKYPLKKPRYVDWSFAGPFGTYDKAQLQRGLKVYTELCSACHSMELVAFRNLADLGYSDEQIKSFAAQYEVEDGPNEDGEMFFRPATPADRFPSPFANREEAIISNGGAYPPDFSLLAKARHVERGFPTFVFDIFTQYAEGAPDYIYSLLTGYTDDIPEEYADQVGDLNYNPYFVGGAALAMAQPLWGDDVEYDDGTPTTLEQHAEDVTAFMMWAAEPKLEERKQLGFRVMVFLIIFSVLLYLSKNQVWSRVEH